MKTTLYELVFGQPPRQSVFPGAKCGSNIMEEDLEVIINDHLPSKSDDQLPSESDDQPSSKSRAQPSSKSHAQTPSDDQPPSESDDQPPSKPRAKSCSSKSRAQPSSKSHAAQTPSDDQPPSESDDQPPSKSCAQPPVSDTQYLSKSRAQDVSESDDQLQITVEKKSNNSPQSIVKANSLLATSDKHKRIREQADASYRRNAERMQVKYTKGKNKKVY